MPESRYRKAIRFATYPLALLIGALLVFVGGDLVVSRSLPDLRPWHRTVPAGEFRAEMDDGRLGWSDWLVREARLFEEVAALKRQWADQATLAISRYRPGANPFARRLNRDWNRSYVLEPAGPPVAVALLVHGLSDSPYSLRSLALALQQAGVQVYGLRLPGHGTVPAALDDVTWRDWAAAVRLAARHIERTRPELPFWYVGYSMGAALGLQYTLERIEAGAAPPAGLVLISPALGVNPLARLANLQRALSHLPAFEKSRWLSVAPEYDPFKYQSFAKNAGRQMALLTMEVDAGLRRLAAAGRERELPPILGFQSVVDETVSTVDLVDRLYGTLDDPRSELVLFDINQESFYRSLTRYSPVQVIASLRRLGERRFRFTLVTNTAPDALAVQALSWGGTAPPRSQPLGLSWPEEVYSLSHVALPFPPDDPVYGLDARDAAGRPLITLGNLAVRGERNVLQVSAADLLRLRANPFHAYLVERTVALVTGTAAK